MRPIDQIYEAFAAAPRPNAEGITAGSGDDERREIRELLAPYRAKDVPDEDLGQYPLYTMFPFLSVAAYRYYMPRCIEFSLKHPGNALGESLLFSLSNGVARKLAASFSAQERAVVREYLEHLSRASPSDYVEEARKLWK